MLLQDKYLPIQETHFITTPLANNQNLTLCIRNNPPLDNIFSNWVTSTGMVKKANSTRISGSPDEIYCFTYLVQLQEEKDYGNYTLMLDSARGSKQFTFLLIRPTKVSNSVDGFMIIILMYFIKSIYSVPVLYKLLNSTRQIAVYKLKEI